MQILTVAGEVQDGIANQLPGAVPGGFATAADLNEGGWQMVRIAKAGTVWITADGKDGVVLQEQQGVGHFTAEVAGDDFLLEGKALGVVDAPEPADDRGGR